MSPSFCIHTSRLNATEVQILNSCGKISSLAKHIQALVYFKRTTWNLWSLFILRQGLRPHLETPITLGLTVYVQFHLISGRLHYVVTCTTSWPVKYIKVYVCTESRDRCWLRQNAKLTSMHQRSAGPFTTSLNQQVRLLRHLGHDL